MKQSEFKKQLEDSYKKMLNAPIVHIRITCKNKEYAKSGCCCCWWCEKCGRRGCDNLIGVNYTRGDTVEEKECDLEEG
jgi:hypothetical protein